MQLTLIRYHLASGYTAGLLTVDGLAECYTLEDPVREEKIPEETAIAPGNYRITYRDEGGMVKRYKEKFRWHKGMLWLRDVPDFEWVYIHIGNFVRDTEGCILVGRTAVGDDNAPMIGDSTTAYLSVYRLVADALDAGEEVWIEVRDV